MKVAILAGGAGTRLSEETATRPKPLIEVGTKPILWHVMMHYSRYNFHEFVIALGYRGEQIKRYFADYARLTGNVRADLRTGEISSSVPEDYNGHWLIDLIETGETTGTGGRIKRLGQLLSDETFMMTYCDGVSDVDLQALLEFHRSHARLATLTAVHPPSRFGHVRLSDSRVVRFAEKVSPADDWINGGFFVLEPGVLEFIGGDDCDWAKDVLPRLAEAGELMAFQHDSFWHCMDTLQEKLQLERMWREGAAPWRTW